MNIYTFYWLDGKREVLEGSSVVDAFKKAGYGSGAINALDFTCNGENNEYHWTGKRWSK